VSSSGGNESLFLQPDASRKELGLFAPSFLPDGRGILYAVYSVDPAVSGIYTVSLEAKQPRRLAGTIALPLFAPPHYLVFGRQQSLLALALADGWSRPEGEASVILDNVRAQSAAPRSYSVSRTGVLAFRENRGGALLQFAWYDRTGRRTGVLGAPDRHLQFQVSPDGRRLAVHGAEVSGRSVVRELSLTSGILAPLAALGIQMDNAAWSPDGREVILSATEKASMNLYRKRVGGGPPSLVLESPENKYVEQWLPDGSILFLNVNGRTFYRLPMAPGAKPEALLTTEYSKDEPQVSPDGRWIVYGANESGVWEVYVAGFPSFEQRRQLSGGGGMQPKWRQDGKEIFYLTPDGVLTAVAFRPGSPPDTGAPQALFKTRVAVMPTRDQYEVLDGGRRFLVLEAEHSSDEPVSVILNWQALLAARPR
jgi:hypothetical protein